MEKKIYVVGLDSESVEQSINTSVSSIAGVSSCVASSAKEQVHVVFDESISGIEDAIKKAIADSGVEVIN